MVLSMDLEESLKLATAEAVKRSHEYITLEHLLLSLTQNDEVKNILQSLHADIGMLRKDLENYLDEELSAIVRLGDNIEPKYTVGVQYILQFAALHVQSTGNTEVKASNVLVALFREQDSHAIYYLNKQEITRYNVLRFISHGVSKSNTSNESHDESLDESHSESMEDFGNGASGENSNKDPFAAFTVDLIQRANDGKIDPCIGRDEEIERTIHILARRRKNNPIFVGDAGVGKTAIVEGLALKLSQGQVPKSIQSLRIYSLDMGLMIAGTKFRGDFEERLKFIIDKASSDPNIVLFIDEIHTIVGAGSVSGGSLDASNLLKPALSNGNIRVVGTTTFREYKSIFEKDHALSRRFQKIDVDEPTESESIAIVNGLKSKYEEFHKVVYSPKAIQSAVELSAKYILDRKLPDKAIDIIDESGALVKLRNDAKPEPVALPKVSTSDIENIVTRMAKIPITTLRNSDKKKLQDLEPILKSRIFGQDKAIEELNESILYSSAGLGDESKPIGSFLFAGPTGVGKTELAKTLAESMNVPLLRFDMSEYMERHSISRLIGSPPGYIGHGEVALLTDEVRKNPHMVLLIDEIEKAHEDVFNLFLQIMDYATLTDSMGRKADFRKAVLIMTTNTGAREKSTVLLGFGERVDDDRDMKALERMFSPEFRNRLTSIIRFNSLQMEQVEKIVEKIITELEVKLKPKKVSIELTSTARSYLANKGFDPDLGARPIARFIDIEIGKKLSKEILFGKLVNGGKVKIDYGSEITFQFE
ncbi:ATP-dependent Clp protease ATP-binding subunit ClpA [Leptospira sp. GIMC2001]|uniref:ATP-dependent Clp protease ATP-binding subunit ClpA n=1 Tax=Leptospira sp. GIMC2001 TaxID=1513297 RepID=UPI003FA53B44